MSRCHRNYFISTAISTVGLLAGGIAGALGIAAAGLMLVECESSAWDTYQDCLNG